MRFLTVAGNKERFLYHAHTLVKIHDGVVIKEGRKTDDRKILSRYIPLDNLICVHVVALIVSEISSSAKKRYEEVTRQFLLCFPGDRERRSLLSLLL